MSVPAWKQAILSRKKQQEEEEKKKQLEKEQYLQSLPPWKRAMLMKKKETSSNPTKTNTNTENQSSPLIKPKNDKLPAWKQARPRSDSSEKQENLGQTTEEKPAEKQPSASSGRKTSVTQTLRGRFEQASQSSMDKTGTPEMAKRSLTSESNKKHDTLKQVVRNEPSPVVEKQPEAKTEPIEQLQEDSKKHETKDSKASGKVEEETKVPTVNKPAGLQKLKGQFEQPTSKRNEPTQSKAHASMIDVDDEKLKSMPKWKQDLIRRKRQLQKGGSSPTSTRSRKDSGSESPTTTLKNQGTGINRSPLSKFAPVSFPSVSKPSSTQNVAPSDSIDKSDEGGKKEVPEVVNKDGPESPKLLHKEGKELKPPVYTVKNKWANVTEDDPEFKNLPEWKRILILRRKNDVKLRTAPPKKEEKKEKPKEEVNEPLPAPLWTPTRSVTVREIPKETEKVEETNPFLDMRKNLRKIPNKRPSLKTEEDLKQEVNKRDGGKTMPPSKEEKAEELEAEESLAPLQSHTPVKKEKRKLRRVSWSDSDLNQSLTEEFSYPKYSYEDYFDIDQDSAPTEETDGGKSDDKNDLATPLHPWLSPPSNSTSSSTQNSTMLSPTSTSTSSSFGSSGSFGMSSFGSLGSFMSAYTGGMTSSSSGSSSSGTSSTTNHTGSDKATNVKSNPIQEPDEEDTAALIW